MSLLSHARSTDHVADLMPAFVNGTLTQPDRTRVMVHIQRCAACTANLRAWQAIREATRAEAAPTFTAPDSVLDGIWAALEGTRQTDSNALSFQRTMIQSDLHLEEELTPAITATYPVYSPTPILPGRRAARPSVPAMKQVLPALLAVAAVLAVVLAGTLVPQRRELIRFGSLLPWQEAIPPDVPMFRGDAARTGVMPGPGPLGKPDVLWRAKTGGPMATSPVISAGVIYTPSLDGAVYAFDAVTGEARWHTEIGGGPQANLTVADGVVLAGDNNPYEGDGSLFALDAKDGHERWRLDNVQTNSPLVIDGIAYVGTSDGHLLALNPSDGSEYWRAPAPQMSRSPALADGLLYYGGRDGNVYAVDAANGQERWRYQTAGGQLGTVAVGGGFVYQATIDGPDDQLYALDAATGEERWRFAIGARLQGPTIGDGSVYIAGGDGSVYALDAALGTVRWRFAVNDSNVFSPVVVGDSLYITSGSTTLFAVDVASGKERWHVDVEGTIGTSSVVSGGIIYVVTDAGELYALGQRTEKLPEVLPALNDAATNTGPVEFLWAAANGTEPIEQMGGMALAPDGTIWIIDGSASRFLIFSPDGAVRETWGEPGPSEGEFNFFLERCGGGYGDIGFDQDGNIYVLDSGSHRVQKFDRSRRFVKAWGTSGTEGAQSECPVTMTVDSQGDVYVADDGRGVIEKFTNNGEHLATISSRGTDDGQTECIAAFGIDAVGTLYVPDCWRHEVQTFSSNGEFLAAWGSEGRNDGQFNFPTEVAIDKEGHVFVTDSGNHRVQVFDREGQFLGSWGSFGSGDGEFNGTGSLALDGAGNIYVQDGNGRIQKFRLLPPLAP